MITLQKDRESFLVIFHFFIWKNFQIKYFANLLLKIHIVAPIDHMFRVSHCWINMKISKCVNFARLYVSSWKFIIILNHTKICLTTLCFFFLYHKLQLFFFMSCTLHPIYMWQRTFEFIFLRITLNFLVSKFHILKKLWVFFELG